MVPCEIRNMEYRRSTVGPMKNLVNRINRISTDSGEEGVRRWGLKRETARRVKQPISAICRWAVAQGHRTDDPAGIVIDASLPRNGVERRHMPALPYDQVADCIDQVKSSARASRSFKLALEFLVLTASRSAEVRKATWDDMDVESATWTVPASRMNANREHRVPLSGGALEVLAGADAERKHPCQAATRARFRSHHARFPVQLSRLRSGADAHAPRVHGGGAGALKDKAEAAYARSDLSEKRRALMESWADYLAS